MNKRENIDSVINTTINKEETADYNKQNEFYTTVKNQIFQRGDYYYDGPTDESFFRDTDLEEEDDFDEAEEWMGNTKKECEIKEISLYDHTLTKEENFADNNEKFVLFRVTKDGEFGIADKENIIPNSLAKCVVNLSTIEDEAEEFTFMPVAYNSFMGVEVRNFMKYNSNFFTCDERVFFITLLVKYKCFDFKPFYWSKEKMFQEIGVKKDRANKIINKFKELGFLSTDLVKTKIDGRPMQVTYFDVDGGKVIDLLPQILHSNEDKDGYIYTQPDIEKYLKPSIKKEQRSISSVMQ